MSDSETSETGTPDEVQLFADFLRDAAEVINEAPAAMWTYEEVRAANDLFMAAYRSKIEEAHAAYLRSLTGR